MTEKNELTSDSLLDLANRPAGVANAGLVQNSAAQAAGLFAIAAAIDRMTAMLEREINKP